jgi:hypothetical protein
MVDHLFTKHVVSPLVIYLVSHGDWGDNGCLGRGGCLGIEKLEQEEREGKGNEVRREGL